jgi:hypothetical protein
MRTSDGFGTTTNESAELPVKSPRDVPYPNAFAGLRGGVGALELSGIEEYGAG